MRPIARQSARLASRSRTSSCSRACRQFQQSRSFNSSVKRATDEPRPPYDPPERQPAFGQHDEEQRRANGGEARTEHSHEGENGETKANGGGRKSRIRSTMRQQRVVDVPKPPPIPEWFLKHNVRLVVDRAESASTKEAGQVVRCVDSETGHTLFTVPYYGKDSQQDAKKQRGKKDQVFFNRSFSEPQAAAVPKDEQKPGAQSDRKRHDSIDPMSWLFLELETTARASLSLPQEHRASSFAASRIDLSLVCPDPNAHDQMDELVQDLARVVDADVVRLDANDIEELTSEYVGSGQDSPGTFSTLGYDVFDGYEAANLSKSPKRSAAAAEDDDEFDMDEDEYDEEDEEDGRPGNIMSIEDLLGKTSKAIQNLGIASVSIGTPRIISAGQLGSSLGSRDFRHSSSSNDVVQWDDARLAALLDSLLDAPKQKRDAGMPQSESVSRTPTVTRYSPFVQEASEGLGRELPKIKEADKQRSTEYQRILRQLRSDPHTWRSFISKASASYIARSLEHGSASVKLDNTLTDATSYAASPFEGLRRTIVHVRDLKDICRSRLGHAIIRRLAHVVQKRRHAGESVLILGTTAQSGYGSFATFPDTRDLPFRTLDVPPFFMKSPEEDHDFLKSLPRPSPKTLKDPAYNRILEINLRHLQAMLRRLRPSQQFDLLDDHARNQMSLQGTHFLTEKVLSLDHVQRLALTAIGLSQTYAKADTVLPVHIALATLVNDGTDSLTKHWSSRARDGSSAAKPSGLGKQDKDGEGQAEGTASHSRIEQVKKSCNQHETRLLTGVVDSQNIKTGFGEVHAPVETIDALKTLTTLSLLRPEAFKYGVLANDRLPGLLLYGPPGTGKTLLAKAVAKESKATVLEVSGAQIYEKYVGEGEKMVRAVFSLAKKLSPCVVFIDEADAIFGSRSNAGNRNTHREIINQFLREWDGMDDHGVFMMVASNRPFDLDDAVLRRLPRRLLVDLPVPKDRESILGIHLKNETLDPSVSLPQLAEQTPLYSGSDLKNLCVAAALACVREENALAEQHKGDKEFKLPEKRTLTSKHFEKAIAEISASISEDMSSLTAIRKFDEQYGDRRGRRKKSGYGFGGGDAGVDESSVRVRQAAPPPP